MKENLLFYGNIFGNKEIFLHFPGNYFFRQETRIDKGFMGDFGEASPNMSPKPLV